MIIKMPAAYVKLPAFFYFFLFAAVEFSAGDVAAVWAAAEEV